MEGIDRASRTEKIGVKDTFIGLQALTKNLVHVLFSRGLLEALVSRPCIFTVFTPNEVYLHPIDIELVKSAYISAGLSWV